MMVKQKKGAAHKAAFESNSEARKQFLQKLANDLIELGKHDLAAQTRQRAEQLKTLLSAEEWMNILDIEWRLYMGLTKPQ
jgi:hypothetical protein